MSGIVINHVDSSGADFWLVTDDLLLIRDCLACAASQRTVRHWASPVLMHGAPAVLQVINRICDACFSADGESTTVDAEFRATASGRAVLVYAPVESGIEPRRVKLSADGLTIKTYWKAVALSLHHPDLTSDCGQKQSRPTAAIERLHAELHDLSSTIEKLNPLKPMIRDAAENFIRKYYGPADRQ